MKTPFLILSALVLTFSANAEVSVNETQIFSLNKVSSEMCGQDKNQYSKSESQYYGCERARKVLYSQAADLTKVESGDEKKPATNVLGSEVVKEGVNVLRSYVVEPPLQNKPEPGKTGTRGIDWNTADSLVRSAARNLLQPVMDMDGNEITYDDGQTIPNHGISHAFIELKCEGLKPILTGMTTGKDLESPRELFCSQPWLGNFVSHSNWKNELL